MNDLQFLTVVTRRRAHALTLAGLFLALAALLALAPTHAAAAKSKKVKNAVIASPRDNQSVSGILRIRPSVKAKKGPYTVKVWIDGKLYNKQRLPTRKYAMTSVPFDTREVANGEHTLRLRVMARSKPRSATQTIKFKVKNSRTGPTGAGQPAPSKNLKNFQLIASEGFSVPAPLGSFASEYDPAKVVYTGATGVRWVTYPQTFVDTFKRHPYRSDQVLSTHDDVLDYWLHKVDGLSAGASISPLLNGDSQYQTYGRYSVRMRIGNAAVDDFHVVFLLWPELNEEFEWAESDFPEQQLMRGLYPAIGYAHYGPKSTQEYILSEPLDMRDWHTYTQEWTPKERRFYLDDKLIHTTTSPVWSKPQRWQLQVQSYNQSSQSGHLFIDWAAAWSYVPGTPAN
jgi:hypothetical protein